MKQFDRKNITPEWKELVEEYPEIFLEPSPEVINYFAEAVVKEWNNVPEKVEDCCNLRYGFECDIGWIQIIREFCVDIRNLIEKAKSNNHEIVYKTCILKEKFGECYSQGSFYGADSHMYWREYDDIVNDLQRKSSTVCEITGRPGKLCKRNYWAKTLCEEKEYDWTNYRI